jgi:hypothetical protein
MPIPAPKQNKPTQMQRAREHYIAVAQRAASLSSELNKLYEVLGEAQNRLKVLQTALSLKIFGQN